MKKLTACLVAFGLIAAVTPSQADVVRKSVTTHVGPMGHGCKTVRIVKRGPMGGKRVAVRKICH